MASMRASIELAAKKRGFVAFEELKGHLTQVSVNSSRTRQELEKLNQRTAAMTAAAKSAAAHVRNFVLAFGAAAGIGSATSGVLALSKELKIASQQLGVTTQDMQAWGLAGQKVGVDMEKMRDIFKDTSDKLGDFVATGGGEAKDIVEKLGLNVAKLNAMRPDQVLLEIGDALNRVKGISQHEKIFLLEALANDASVLLPLLENNGKLLNDVRAKAELRGQIISPADMAMLTEANDKISESKAAMAGFKHQVGLLAAEFMTLSGTGFTDFIDGISAKLNAFNLTVFVAQVQHGFLVMQESAKMAAMYVSTEFDVLLLNLGARWPEQFAALGAGWSMVSAGAGAAFAAAAGFSQDAYSVIVQLWSGELSLGAAFAGIVSAGQQSFGELATLAEGAFERVKATFIYGALAGGVQRALSDIKALWADAVAAWDNLTGQVSTAELASDQQSGWGSISTIVQTATSLISGMVENWWSLLTGVVSVGLKVLQGDFSGAWAVIESGVQGFITNIQGAFDGIGGKLLPEDLRTMGADILAGLATVGTDILAAIGPALRDVMALVQELRETVWHHWGDITAITTMTWDLLSTTVSAAWNAIESTLSAGLQLLRGDFSGAWQSISSGVNDFLNGPGNSLAKLAGTLGGLGLAAVAAAKAFGTISTAIGVVGTAVKGLSALVLANPITATIAAIAVGAYLIYDNWDGIVAWWQNIWAKVEASAAAFFSWWDNVDLAEKSVEFVADTLEWVDKKAREFVDWWNNLSLKSLIPDIQMPDIPGFDAGKDIVDGIVGGVQAGAKSAVDALAETGSAMASGFKSVLGIQSPSRVMYEAGEDIDAGLANGISAGTGVVVAAADGMVSSLQGSLSEAANSATALDGVGVAADSTASKIDILRSAYEQQAAASAARIAASRAGIDALREQQTAEVAAAAAAQQSQQAAQSAAVITTAAAAGKKAATGATKQLSEAEREAKKSADELAAAQKKISEQFVSAAQQQEILNTRLTSGDAAARQLELRYDSMHNGVMLLSAERAAELQQMEAASAAIEKQIAKRDEEKKAIEAAQKAVEESQRATELLRIELLQGADAAKLAALADEHYSSTLAQQKLEADKLAESYKNQIAVKKELAGIDSQLADTQANLAVLQSGGIKALEANQAQQKAVNSLKEQGIDLESSLAQEYLKSTQALASAQKELENQTKAAQSYLDVQKELVGLNRQLSDATGNLTLLRSQGADALDRHKVVQGATNQLIEKGISLESDLAKQYIATAQQIAEVNKQTEDYNKLLADAKSVYEATRTDAEKYAKEVGELDKLKAAGVITLETYNRALEDTEQKYTDAGKAAEAYKTEQDGLNDKIKVMEAGLSGGAAAARAAELGLKNYNAEQIQSIQTSEEHISTLESLKNTADGIGNALVDGLMSGDWKSAGRSVLGSLKSFLFDPLMDKMKSSISGAMSNLLGGKDGKGGIMGALGGSTGGIGGWLGGIGTALGGVGSSIGTAVSGVIGSLGSGLGGIGSALSTGLAGIGSSLGGVAAALGPVGLAVGGIAALASIFGGPSDPELTFTQGARDGQGMLGQGGHNGQAHRRESVFGMLGATDASNKIGRREGFVPEFHAMMDAMVELDQIIADTLPNSIDNITAALEGVEMAGFSMSDMLKSRYQTVFKALPAELQRAMQGGKNIMGGTAEEIIARFQEMAAASQVTVPALEQLGWNVGDTSESAIAAALRLSDAAGGLDNLTAGLERFYNAAYTQAERDQMMRDTAQQQLDAFNTQFGLVGNRAIDNVLALRAFIEAQDATTKKGAEAIAAAMAMIDAAVAIGGTADDIAAAADSAESAATNAASSINNQAAATQGLSTAANDAAYDLAGLKTSISDLVTQLYGDTGSTSTGVSDNGLSAAQTELELLQQRYETERERIETLNRLAEDNYRAELAHYESLKAAAEDLRDFVLGWTRSNPLLTPFEQLQETQRQYDMTLSAARAGDVDAARELQTLASELRSAYTDVYASSDTSVNAIDQITRDLSGLSGTLDTLAGTEPQAPAEIASTVLAALEQQISTQQQLISTLQSSQNSSAAASDRTALASELAGKIGELGLAMDQSVFELLRENGIAIDALATDFGIDLTKLDQTFATQITELSGLLHTDSLTLISELGADLSELGRSFGVNINQLNADMLGKLDGMADTLSVDIVSLSRDMGGNIDQLGDLIAGKLTALPNIPADIKTGLAPYLSAIEAANDPTTLQLAIAALQGRVDQLPPGIKSQLNAQLSGIVGNTSGITGSIGELISSNATAIAGLAESFGIDVAALDNGMLSKIDSLADSLHIDSVSLMASLGGSIDQMGDLIAGRLTALPNIPSNIRSGLAPYLTAIENANDPTTLQLAIAALQGRVDQLPPGIKSQLNAQLSGIVGNTSGITGSIGELISSNAAAIAGLADSFGIDVAALDNGMLSKIDSLADSLHIDSVSLMASLGGSIDQMGDLIAGRLTALPNIPSNIRSGLAPYLTAIERANNTGALQTELKRLQSYVNTLPPGIKSQLNSQLQSIVGYTAGTQNATGQTTAAVNSNTGVASQIKASTAWTVSHLSTISRILNSVIAADMLSGIRQTLWQQNLKWGKSGNGSAVLNKYAVGSDYIDNDQIAQIHRGESIFTARQTGRLRDDVLTAFDMIPQLAGVVMEAANQPQAVEQTIQIEPRVIDARPVFTGSQREQDNRTQQELLAEIRELNKKVERLEQGQQYYGNLHAQQGDTAIRQRDESNQTQKQARRDAYRAGRNVA